MKSSIKIDSLESSFIQILKGMFNIKSTSNIMSTSNVESTSKKSKGNGLNKNELDYFEYTYVSDSPS